MLQTSTARAPAADAQPQTFALNWVREPGAESCVSSSRLAQMLEQLTGPVLRQPADAVVAIEGVVRRDETTGGWRVHIRITDSAGVILGERELKNREPRCTALTPSLLLVLAVIIDPDAAQRGLPSVVVEALARDAESETVAPPPPDERALSPVPVRPAPRARPHGPGAQVVRDSPEPPRSAQAPDRSSYVEPMAALLVGVGVLPGTNFGPSVGAALTRPDLGSLILSAAYLFPETVPIQSPRALADGMRIRAAELMLSACRPVFTPTRFRLSGCLGLVGGYRWTQADALALADDPARPFFGGSLGTELRFDLLRSLFVFGNVSAALILPRDRFVYTDSAGRERPIYEAERIAGWSAFGAGLRL